MAGSLGHKKEISRGYAALFAMNAIFLKKKISLYTNWIPKIMVKDYII